MPGADAELAAALKHAKTATADSPSKFVLVMKGGTDGGLIISKQKIPPGNIVAVKKSTGGSAVIKGVCFGEDGKLVFEIAKDPAATMAAALKKIIQRDANLIYTVICRKGTHPELAADQDEAPSPTATTKAPTAPRETPAAEWARRLAELTPRLKQALQVGSKKIVPDLKASFALAKSKAEARDFGQALSRVATIEGLIDSALATPTRSKASRNPATEDFAPADSSTVPTTAPEPLADWQQASKDVAVRVVQLQGVLRQTRIAVLREMGDEMLAALRKYIVDLTAALADYERAAGDAKETARLKAAA